MSTSDRAAFVRTTALLFGVALLAFFVSPRLAPPPTATEIRQTIAQHLEAIAHARTDRAKTMHQLAVYFADHRPAAVSAMTTSQIDHIASLIVDRDRDVARQALRVLSHLGPPARPAAARVIAYIRSEPSLRFDRFAWDVEFTLDKSGPSIHDGFQLIEAMKQSTPKQKVVLVRRIAMVADHLVVHSDRVNPRDFLDSATEAIADILGQKDAPYSLLSSAASALRSLGPNARGAIPALERALAKAKVEEVGFSICAGFCPSLADEYQRALACIRMDPEQFEIDYRFGRSCAFPSKPHD